MNLVTRRSLLRRVVVVAFLAVLAALLIALRQSPPSSEGRTLNDWLGDLDLADEPSRLAAERALARMGPQAVPTLRAQLARRDPFLAPAFRKMEPYLPRWAWRRLFLLLKPDEIELRRKQAAQGLGLIGPPASVAVPDLIRALSDANPTLPPAASQALARIGMDAVPALTNALATASAPARVLILAVLAKDEPQADLALPSVLDLLACTTSSDEVNGASRLLGTLGGRALPPLVLLLGAADAQTRNNALRALQLIADRNPSLPLKLGELYPAQPLPVRATLVDLLEQTAYQRHLTACAMLPVVLDPDPQLQRRAMTWFRQHMEPSELERLLSTQTEPNRLRLREALLSSSAGRAPYSAPAPDNVLTPP